MGSATRGKGTATIFRGTQLDIKKEYFAQVVLNRGSEIEIRGDKTCLLTNYCNQVAVTDMLSCPNRVKNPNWIYQYDGCTIVPDNPTLGFLTAFSSQECIDFQSDENCTGACDEHDRCYQTCWAGDLEAARLACDDKFLSNARLTCLNEVIINPLKTAECLSWAETYYQFLRVPMIGGTAFMNRQKQVCFCCE